MGRIHVAAAVLAACALAACATADVGSGDDDDDGTAPDAAFGGDAAESTVDGPVAEVDAPEVPDAAAAPDATGTPDAIPAPDAACTAVWIQLLDNADFDAGNTAWTETGATLISDSLPLTPDSGTFAARLLGFNGAQTTLSQQVAVPADATALRVRGVRCWVTAEPAGSADDTLRVELRDGGGGLLETLATASSADASPVCGWVSFELTAGDGHAGQTVELAFEGVADGLDVTSFYYDTLALEAFACP